jgi:branched-subunit amino acid aminotransferase/4-amino-4-deoxychorismate lyase
MNDCCNWIYIDYLINALCAMEAQEKGGVLGLQLDERGMVAECSVGSVGFLGTDGVLRSPKVFNTVLH